MCSRKPSFGVGQSQPGSRRNAFSPCISSGRCSSRPKASPGGNATGCPTGSDAYEQTTFCLLTAPFDVGALNVQETVSTTVPAGCSTVIVADVNARSSMFSLQFGLWQSGAPGIGVVGPFVVTENDTLPFLISEAGID